MANQNQLSKPVFPEFSSEAQQWLSQLADTVNSLQGYNGVIKLNNHVDLGGNQLKNVAAPTEATDALTSGIAEASYSAPVLAPQLESTGSSSLKTMRQLNSPVQREQSSSFLNDLQSTTPNANQIYPTLTVSGSNVQSVIPSSPFTFADGSTLLLHGRTDLLSIPAQYTISSISASGGLVTVVTTTTTPLVAGQAMTVVGVSAGAFNGTYTCNFANPGTNTLQYQDSSASGSSSGGYVQVNGIWYYYVKKRSSLVYLSGPYASDTASNRLQTCYDGNQIVAVVAITASGFLTAQSGGGGSAIVGSPTAGSMF